MFHVGQLVECVNDDGFDGREWRKFETPKRGVIYTVRDTGPSWTGDGDDAVWLEEIQNPVVYWSGPKIELEPQFRQSRFRPLSDFRLAIFRSLLQPIPSPEKERA
jgi:hypothetical protein